MPPTTTSLDPQLVNLAKAIRQTESQGNFQATGKSGEYGAYQFMPETWASSSQKYLGQNVPLASATPEQQNEVAYKQLAEWKQQHPDWNIGNYASAWNAGPGKPNAYQEGYTGTNAEGVSYDTPGYALKVAQAYQQIKGQTGGQQGGYGYVGGQQPPVENNATQDFGGTNTTDTQPQGLGGQIASGIGNLAKGITEPLVTLLARPLQAGAEALGATDQQVNAVSSKVPIYGANGGLNVPENGADVQKDVGRGAETVALGLGPVAGGAAFGAGNSVEQGNNILSGQTALQAGIGGATGGLLSAASPLLGKVGSAIAPKILKDAGATAGEALAPAASAIGDFANRTKILPQGVSDAINKGADVLNAAPGRAAQGVASQYGFGAGATRKDALDAVSQALGDTGKKSAGVFVKGNESRLQGLENMEANSSQVKLANGNAYDPTSASLSENVEALNQLKQNAYQSWMKEVTGASGSGVTVDTDPVTKKLLEMADNPGNTRLAPQAAKVAAEVKALNGDPVAIQRYLETLNNGLKGVFQGGQHSLDRDVDAQAVTMLNDVLDKSVIDTESDALPIREAKNLYSSYKAVEDGLVKKAQMAARRADGGMGGGLYDYINPFNIADALEFFVNPIGAAKGVVRAGLLAKAKAAKDPENILQGIFKTIQNYKGTAPGAASPGIVGNLVKNAATAGVVKSAFPQNGFSGAGLTR